MDESNKRFNKMLAIREIEFTMPFKIFRQIYISVPLLSVTRTLFFLI